MGNNFKLSSMVMVEKESIDSWSIEPIPRPSYQFVPRDSGIVSNYNHSFCISNSHAASITQDPQLDLTPEKKCPKKNIDSDEHNKNSQSSTHFNGSKYGTVGFLNINQKTSSQPLKELAHTWNISTIPCSLDKPQINSSLGLSQTIIQVQSAELNAKKAVLEKLERNETVKQRFREKVSEQLNAKDNIFKNILPVDFTPKRIISKEEEEKQELVKEALKNVKPREKDPEPDFYEFFTDDLQVEYLNLDVPTSKPHIKPEKAPIDITFDIYKYLHLHN